MKITNRTRNTLLGDRIEIADSIGTKFMGLMGRSVLGEGEGLLLKDTPAIHMCFMRIPIDAIFLDEQFRIAKICSSLRPWIGLAGAEARDCLELPAGTAERTGCAVGDELEMSV